MILSVHLSGVFTWTLHCIVLYYTTALPFSLPCEKNSALCGSPAFSPVSSKIVGGEPAQRGTWPWMVSLEYEGFHECGGALISEDIVLTAAHCFLGKAEELSKWTAFFGRYRLDRVERGQKTLKVQKIISHSNFNVSTVVNDIALLVLSGGLSFSESIRPICLPREGQEVKVGQTCLLAGWGATRGTADQNALNQVALPIVADETCGLPDWYGKDFSEPGTTFCAGYEQGLKDACMGDSGGPLICFRENIWFIQGISSWGYGCAERKWPGIYTEVDKYLSWIHEEVALHRNYCSATPILG